MRKRVAPHFNTRWLIGLVALLTAFLFFASSTGARAENLPSVPVTAAIPAPVSVLPETPPPASTPGVPALAGEAVSAVPNGSPVVLDGEVRVMQAYTIEGNNYFKLRELARVLARTPAQFDVRWNAQEKAVEMITGVPYDQPPAEGVAAGIPAVGAWPSASPLYLDGAPILVTAYTIEGSNYFKLRDIGRLLGFPSPGIPWPGGLSWMPVCRTKLR